MKKPYFILLAVICMYSAKAQDLFITRHGQVSFFSKTPLENIDATNNEASSVINIKTGEIGFAILIKSFHFERALMEEHFNENYMESDKLPKANFKGKINNLAAADFTKDGTYAVTVDGEITIHGVTQKLSIPGSVMVKDGLPQVLAKFKIAPKDYNIKIPSLVADKIAESMNVSVDCKYEKK
jgi:polyisoprenoid-binding protein YceI